MIGLDNVTNLSEIESAADLPTSQSPQPCEVNGGDRGEKSSTTNDSQILRGVERAIADAVGCDDVHLALTREVNRPWSRILFCTLNLDSDRTLTVIVKTIRATPENRSWLQRGAVRDFKLNVMLHECLASQSTRLTVPRPVCILPEDLVIVTEYAPGVPLHGKILEHARWLAKSGALDELEHDCSLAGEWLKAFQNATRPYVQRAKFEDLSLDTMDLARLRQMVDTRLGQVASARRGLLTPQLQQRVCDHFDLLAKGLDISGDAIVGVHGDYFPGNLLIQDDTIVGLDFTQFRSGSAYFDPSYFLFQLGTLANKPQFSRSIMRRLGDAFLRGYDPRFSTRRAWEEQPEVKLMNLLHEITRLLSLVNCAHLPSYRRAYRWMLAARVARNLVNRAEGS